MTNEEKAQEIAESCYSKRTKDISANRVGQLIIKQSCLKMAEWKEKQMVDKACEYLKNYRRDIDGTGYIAGIVDDETVEDFKIYMKGE